ncbi:MAG: efflux RND transporter permease subunit [Candidatus Binataceae bacterium]
MPSFSLRNPHFVIVGALVIALLGVTAFARMPVDVFPNLKVPAVMVATFYPGMPPLDIERNITVRYERFFTLGSGIEHIESRSLPGVSIIKVYYHPGVSVDAAASELATLAMADLKVLPPGTLPPLVLKFDPTMLPVVLVTAEGKGFTEVQLEDQARYNVRTQIATVSGASIPVPFGGKFRQIMVYVDRQALEARGLTLDDIVKAVNDTNLILPAGDAKIGPTDYYIYSNSLVDDAEELNTVPIKVGTDQAPVLLRDVGHAEDSTRIQYNKVLINGQPSVYIPVLKQTGANTISVVEGVKNLLPNIVGLPPGMKLKAIFDQSGYIFDAVHALEHEAVLGSVLAALIILIFLGSFRSTVAIFLSIPLSILAGGFGLYMNDSTINIMTLGGFALAIGRLVDNSVVVLENINRHLAAGEEPTQAARKGAEEVDLAVLASTITTVIVFFPVTFLFGMTKYLFSALALAVVLAMAASYVVAMTIIPLYCARFLTVEEARALESVEELDAADARTDSGAPGPLRGARGLFARFNRGYERFARWYEVALRRALDHKLGVIGALTALFLVSMALYPRLGTQLFPTTDAGKFAIKMGAPLGSRLEVSEAYAHQVEAVVRSVIPPDELEMVVSNLGLNPSFTAIYSTNASEDTGEILVSLNRGHRRSTLYYMERLRRALRDQVPAVRTFFTSGSIIDAVLNFGAAAPIDIQLRGPDYKPLFALAHGVQRAVADLPEVADAFIPEEAGYPTLNIRVDRVRAGRLGITQRDVITNVITALTSSQMIAPSIWLDRKNGNDYFLTVQYPENNIVSSDTLLDIPVRHRTSSEGHPDAILLRNVADVMHEGLPGEADHYDVQRIVDVMVNPKGSDLGGAQAAIQRRLATFALPHDYRIDYRGSVAMMGKSFSSLGFGLILAVALLYLVMVAQFRSFLDPLIIMFAVPMGLIGVMWTLLATGTTLNIESFMGIILMVGIVVSNSILLVDFTNHRYRGGQELRAAVVEASRIRMRPILITALATVGALMPIALKIGVGSEASAPLARAAIGGLAVSTVLTLILVPCVYELFYARGKAGESSAQ